MAQRVDVGDALKGHLELTLLGRWALRIDDQPITVGTRERRLIACVAIHGSPSRDQLAELLWPSADVERRSANLRTSLWSVRRTTPGVVVAAQQVVRLSRQLECDLHRLRSAIGTMINSPAVATSGERPGFGDIIFCGLDLLPGWYDDWVLLERARLRNQQLRALLSGARRLLDSGQPSQAIRYASRAVEIEPCDDAANEFLISAHLERGHPAAALMTIRRYQYRLQRELGVPPSPSLLRLKRRALEAS